jgi:glyoxylase-like metal-dependent hydrolase (beta-lactamase superfamily II)
VVLALRTGAGVAPMEISPGVYEISLTRVRAHLIVEEELTLIDAGLSRSRARIAHAIESLGRALPELTRVICTHGHPDHAGGAPELMDAGAEILMH